MIRAIACRLAVVLMQGCAEIQRIDWAAGELARELRTGTASADEVTVLSDHSRPCAESREDVVRVELADVDTAYVRLKRFFAYKTLDEKIQASPWKKREWIDGGFRHEATPGVRYWMKDVVNLRIGPQQQRGWFSTEIERDGRGAVIHLKYCIGGSEGFAGGAGFPASLRDKVIQVAEGRR